MDRWLGNGGMELIGTVGASFDDYGVDGEDLGWVAGVFTPLQPACNPHGIVQAGVHGLLLDAAMNFAINSALPGRDRTKATLEMKIETMRPALLGESYRLRGDVVRMARQIAYGEATVRDKENQVVSRSTGTIHAASPRSQRKWQRRRRLIFTSRVTFATGRSDQRRRQPIPVSRRSSAGVRGRGIDICWSRHLPTV